MLKFRAAQSKAHPFDAIGKSIFVSEDAVQLATIDSMTGLVSDLLKEEEPFYFADLCAGPGGFADYLLWKTKSHERVLGFGITRKGSRDFSLEFLLKNKERFVSVYGADKTGNICKTENITDFSSYVKECTGGEGVHLIVAGGVRFFNQRCCLFC
jgi:cap1 methyltransferase